MASSSISGLTEFVAKLHSWETAVVGGRHARDGLQVAANMIRDEARSALGTYRYGWPRLSDKTVKRKRTGDSPLLETGAMRNSIQATVRNDVAEVGTNDPKAAFHEFGTSKMPPRPFLAPAAQAKEKAAVDALAQHVYSIFR